MSIERKLLTKIARMLGAMACVVALGLELTSCISPDLEPPGGGRTSLPSAPTTPKMAADTQPVVPTGAAAADPSTTAGSAAMAPGAPGAAMTTPDPDAAEREMEAATAGQTPPPADGAAGAASMADDEDAGVPAP